ncbi:hypothetical protein [Lelliottia nimipressuralis]|uniref:Excisionase n=1 Tax=Lelliottia nimipressuralis TaxID=69220 RepID=A0ABD4K605_9ENTR|nr:hypothetical protein [Lelliottia nimipressuralis]MBF4177261.1 hypothetical protein [Lelliottia nimipressuralis]
MELIEFIEKYFNGSKQQFADSEGVKVPQVYQWIEKGFIVVNGSLYSPRRKLKIKELNK